MSYMERVVVLVDMDCFYCQVEEKLDPTLEGKPIAVVQYNAWRGGGIIAVNYPARDKGVKRGMRGDEAKQKCPDIMLPKVPQVRGKADLTKYREAGKRVADALQTFNALLERASVDEAYLDITEEVRKRLENGIDQICIEKLQNTFVVGCEVKDFIDNLKQNSEFAESNIKLAIGGIITEEIRAKILKETGYKCSAGIAHNKILAKLVCGLHKPNKQTILPQNSITELYKDLPLRKIKSLGGKFGNALSEELQISYMGELIKFSERELAKKFDDKTAKWLHNIARGIDLEPVTTRLVSKSIGCCKNFPGKSALKTPEMVEHWINELATEISERLEKDLEENNRRARQMVVSFAQETNSKNVNSSRTHPLNSYDKPKIAQNGIDVLRRFCLKADGTYHITFLGLSVGQFQDLKNNVDITSFFKNMQTQKNDILQESSKQVKTESSYSSFQTIAKKNVRTDSNTLLKTNELVKCGDTSISINKIEDQTTSKIETCITKGTLEDSNCSVYSASTEELNEDTSNLIYYEDVFSVSDSSQTLVKNDKTNLVGSTSTSNGYDNNNEIGEPSSKSFFVNYFRNEGISVVDKNFANSDEEDASSSVEVLNNEDFSSEATDATSSNVLIHSEDSSDIQVCPECNKKIMHSDFVSHMDYHFSLKLVKDEAHLYRPSQIKVVTKEIKTSKKQASKRKLPETKQILTFLQKSIDDNLDESNSQLCSDCNKKIKLEDIVSHTDYHAAKKLHSELNSPLINSKNINPASVKVKDKKIKAVKNMRTITTFFKT